MKLGIASKIVIALVFGALVAAFLDLVVLYMNNPPVDAPGSGSLPVPGAVTPRATARSTRAPLPGQLVFSSEQEGRWEIHVSGPEGQAARRLTNDGTARSPVASRDGSRVAYESHRDGNWEIYTIGAGGTVVTRLTRSLAFDGRPAWSPDGQRIAFASARKGDLDIWVMNADGSQANNLTAGWSAVDDLPSWSPDGNWIAFSSWRGDTAQIYAVSPDGAQTLNLSQSKFDDQSPVWSPDGKQIAFVSDRDGQRAIYVAPFSVAGLKNPRRVTFSGWEESPTWSPDGQYLAFVSPRPSRRLVYVTPVSGGIPVAIGGGEARVQSVAWATVGAWPAVAASGTPASLRATPVVTQTMANLIPLKDVFLAPSFGRLSDRVSDSFIALRARVKAEAGWDFLDTLADMTRQLNGGECGDGCQYLSWHKAGRAVDTRLAVDSNGVPMLEIVRQDLLGETYWRILLRAAKQDGTQGEPMTVPPWDLSYSARWTVAPGQGGVRKAIPGGYYVDFTELARQYGWERISSYDDEDLSWKENKAATEFWHIQNTGGLSWYAAVSEIYSSQVLANTLDWNALAAQGEDVYLMRIKELPAPPPAWRWFVLGP